MKLCRGCGLVKPLDDFRLRRVDGKQYRKTRCKVCENAALIAYKSAKRKARREAAGLPPHGWKPQTSQCAICHQWKPISDFLDAKQRIRKRCLDCLNGLTPQPTERRCGRCGQVKPITEYSKVTGKRALKSWCKVCNREAKAEWYAANLDRIRQYEEAHRDTRRAFRADQKMRRRARFYDALTGERIDRAAIIARDGGVCYLCGASPTGRDLTLDHVIPLVQGGSHTAVNLRVACRSCNSRKGIKVSRADS